MEDNRPAALNRLRLLLPELATLSMGAGELRQQKAQAIQRSRTVVLHTLNSVLRDCQLINEKKQLWSAAQDVIGTGLQ